jgi:hypothetical protein
VQIYNDGGWHSRSTTVQHMSRLASEQFGRECLDFGCPNEVTSVGTLVKGMGLE